MVVSDDELKLVSSPEDDRDPDKVDEATSAMKRHHEAELLYIAESLGMPLNTSNDFRRVIGFCYRANGLYWYSVGKEVSPNDRILQEECRVKIKKIDHAQEASRLLAEAHNLGIRYRIERYQSGL